MPFDDPANGTWWVSPAGSWIDAYETRPTSAEHELLQVQFSCTFRRGERRCSVTMSFVSADSYPDLLERLFAAFEDRHSLAVIEAVATQSRDELAGQTRPGAQFEMLERLARQRLADRPPTR